MKKIIFSAMSLALILFSSCQAPLDLEARVTVSNTLQIAADLSMGGTGGVETPVEAIFGAPEGTYILSAIISEGIEFDDYLEGLYDIDLSE